MKFNTEKENAELREIRTETSTVFEGRLLHVIRDSVRLPNGDITGREAIRHVGAVCVVPVTDEGKVIVERQYRYPIDEVITEIPAGKLDSRQEDRLSAAKRELREETGITADNWTDMGMYYPSAAYSDEKISMYLATGLHRGSQELDEDEFLNVTEVPMAELLEAVMAGEIPDGKTQTALLKAARILGL